MMEKRIIIIVNTCDFYFDSLELLNQCVEIYMSKGIQDGISHLSLFSYHLILIFFTEGIRNYPSACRNYSKNGIDPNSCPIAGRC